MQQNFIGQDGRGNEISKFMYLMLVWFSVLLKLNNTAILFILNSLCNFKAVKRTQSETYYSYFIFLHA